MSKKQQEQDQIFYHWLYRGVGLVMALLITGIHFVVGNPASDPLWARLGMSGIVIALVLVSLANKVVFDYLIPIVVVLGILINLLMEYITITSGMASLQFFAYFAPLLCFSILIRQIRYNLLLYVSNIALAVGMYLFMEQPDLDWRGFIFAMAATVTLGIGLALVENRQKNQQSEKENMLRIINAAAFRQINAGIMVTDLKGKVIHFNEKLLQAWSLSSDLVNREDLSIIVTEARNSLKNPADAVKVAALIRNDPMAGIDDQIEMKDGRFFHRISRPLLQEDKLIGRIWFYYDVSRLKQKEARLEATREQMRRQNEVMVHLAGSNAVNEGQLEIAFQDVLRAVATGMETDGAEIWMLDEKGKLLECKSRYNLAQGLNPLLTPMSEEGHQAFFQALRVERAIDAPDARRDTRLQSFAAGPNDPGSVLIAPIRLHGNVVGMVRTYNRRRMIEWPVESQNFLVSISDLLAVMMETAERRKAEFQLEKSHAILQSVFELSGLGILVTTLKGEVITYNRLYLDIWGLDDEYMGKSAATIIAYCQAQLRNSEQLRTSMTFLMENPDQDQYDFLEFHDGRFAERFTSVLEVDETIIGRVWFFRDITDRIESEKRLQDSELRNKAILNALPDLMLRLSMEGRIIDIKFPENEAFPHLTENVRGQQVQDSFPASFVEAVLAQAKEAQKSAVLRAFEIEMNLTGQERDYEARVVPSNTHEVLLIVRDITERKRAEKELVQRNFELDSFVYRASHDLKAPLNSLMGLIDIVRSENSDKNLLMYLGLMDKSVVKLDTFIRNLTDFSRINRLQIEHQKVDFESMISEIGESLRYMEFADRVRKVLHIEPGVQLYADGFHIGIVLSNLISNAIKYQDHSKADPYVRIAVTVEESQATIEVEDNGMGIPPEHQDRIFELFFRASNQSFGSGLGLYITRNAVEKMAGTISFVSTPKEGTRFTVVIPNQIRAVLSAESSGN